MILRLKLNLNENHLNMILTENPILTEHLKCKSEYDPEAKLKLNINMNKLKLSINMILKLNMKLILK